VCAPTASTSFRMIQAASDSGNAAALFFLFDLLYLDGRCRPACSEASVPPYLGGGGRLFVVSLFAGDMERERLVRIRRAYEKKCAQLSPWRRDGARTVLILEEDDRDYTNQELVTNALSLIEREAVERPNEIYLLSTIVKTWALWTIRIDDYVYDDFSVGGTSLLQIDPATLDDLTGR
jgi:hypothetical protein